MRTNRRQHTVPRFYLKRFADGKSAIWQFDKKTGKCKRASVRHVAVRRDFYPEERLSRFEDVYAPSVDKLIECKSYYFLGKTDRYNVRLFANHMGARTEQARNDIVPRTAQVNRCLGTDTRPDPPHAQNDMIRDGDMFGPVNFTVVENKTCVPFVTSDNPVADFLIEVHLPLTPRLSLALLHGRLFKKAERVELKDEGHADYQNFLHMCNAGRFVYSGSEFRPSLEMLSAARGWRKVSRYAEHNLCNACCVKPSLPGIAPHEFELSDPKNAQQIRSVRDGTLYAHASDYDIRRLMLRAVLHKYLLTGQIPTGAVADAFFGTRHPQMTPTAAAAQL